MKYIFAAVMALCLETRKRVKRANYQQAPRARSVRLHKHLRACLVKLFPAEECRTSSCQDFGCEVVNLLTVGFQSLAAYGVCCVKNGIRESTHTVLYQGMGS